MKKPVETTEMTDPVELAEQLATSRDLEDARRADELARKEAAAAHARRLAEVETSTRQAELDRVTRERTGAAAAELHRFYLEARDAGERIRIRAHMARSGEQRALGLDRLRGLNLKVLVPVLLGFAAWSTTGVQAGGARLMGVTDADPMWWTLWILEPVLVGAAVWVIIATARLAACGGTMDDRASRIMWGCLATSIVLNLAASTGSGWALAGAMLAHAIGPVGAAGTAHLIGIVSDSISDADPWHGGEGEERHAVPLLKNLDLTPADALADASDSAPAQDSPSAPEEAEEAEPVSAPVTPWPIGSEGRRTLPIVARPAPAAAAESMPSSVADLDQQRSSAAAAVRRSHKGTRVPAAARKRSAATSARKQTDDELRVRLAALVEAGTLPADAPVRQVQAALGIGFERAKRITTPAPPTASENAA